MDNQGNPILKRPKEIATLIFLILDLLYVISPIDFIPDFIPVIGWIDDIIAILIGASLGIKYLIKKRY
ncbi:MAG TPA: DUF1232 domain-containing protein [Methanofastidiosum sp.]|nr:DUF1232 domain-containing protein [Methanofastidiosum sp.]HPA49170.1 DUF1232 domain-containing protein [Methanofastidiosum sp.]HQK62420.1 DUF1232 domain-containing protein [Methanofastidiosum sp.]HQM94629.1 DUF1232 domain-containing protein [Methanofastidiosum sp.]HQQ48628.1 DUF1232 domain-containing protein [Methanofastidiosum sp.]